MDKIFECPFCGGEASVWDKTRYDVCVRCDECDVQTKWMPTVGDAIAAWNRRPEPRPLTLEELKQVKGCPVWIINPRTGINLGCKVLEIYIGGCSDSRSDRFVFTDRYMIFEVLYGIDAVAYDRPPGGKG